MAKSGGANHMPVAAAPGARKRDQRVRHTLGQLSSNG
jgi:hypothetical protein